MVFQTGRVLLRNNSKMRKTKKKMLLQRKKRIFLLLLVELTATHKSIITYRRRTLNDIRFGRDQ